MLRVSIICSAPEGGYRELLSRHRTDDVNEAMRRAAVKWFGVRCDFYHDDGQNIGWPRIGYICRAPATNRRQRARPFKSDRLAVFVE